MQGCKGARVQGARVARVQGPKGKDAALPVLCSMDMEAGVNLAVNSGG